VYSPTVLLRDRLGLGLLVLTKSPYTATTHPPAAAQSATTAPAAATATAAATAATAAAPVNRGPKPAPPGVNHDSRANGAIVRGGLTIRVVAHRLRARLCKSLEGRTLGVVGAAATAGPSEPKRPRDCADVFTAS
jgi:hypothetical protein